MNLPSPSDERDAIAVAYALALLRADGDAMTALLGDDPASVARSLAELLVWSLAASAADRLEDLRAEDAIEALERMQDVWRSHLAGDG